jgi:predicted O-methyltransferase YrrM
MYLRQRALGSLRSGGPVALVGHVLRHIGDRLMTGVAARKLRSAAAEAATLDDAVDLAFSFEVADVRITPLQVREEIVELLRRLAEDPPRRVLEIGTANGGSLFLLTRVARTDATIVSVDLPGGLFGGGYPASRAPLYESFARGRQSIELMRADSHDQSTCDAVATLFGGSAVDFVLIDGDHSLEGVRRDFELYAPLVRDEGLIALHDIVPASPGVVGGVPAFWKELKDRLDGEEIVADRGQGGFGIGLIRKKSE